MNNFNFRKILSLIIIAGVLGGIFGSLGTAKISKANIIDSLENLINPIIEQFDWQKSS